MFASFLYSLGIVVVVCWLVVFIVVTLCHYDGAFIDLALGVRSVWQTNGILVLSGIRSLG